MSGKKKKNTYFPPTKLIFREPQGLPPLFLQELKKN